MEGDRLVDGFRQTIEGFQSTPSAWRETLLKNITIRNTTFQSTPSAWRETPYLSETHPTQSFQSTPSAWRETIGLALPPSVGSVFQSTPSAWRETRSHCTSSIMPGYFNPLPPHGGRRYQDIMYDRNRNISIHSLRMEGDSTKRKQQELDRKISIHSLRME